MPYYAVALARSNGAWSGKEIELADIEDLDSLTDSLRDLDGNPVLCFIEEDDEYVGIVRVDPDTDDSRIFLSDRRVLDTSELADRLFADALPVDETVDEAEDENDTVRPDADPAGDVDLLSDLGTPSDVLVEICAGEGMLPADVISAVCERLGAVDVLEEVRGA
jgi:putative tRNA adenosine deaminase-associated protein